MKKKYISPKITNQFESKHAFPLVAPLAFFSASSAAAAVGGAVAGAVATKKLIKASPNEHKNIFLYPICD